MVALAVDPSGARVLTGSYDYTVRMYDFGGMDARLKAFREITPFEGHQVRALTWSPTGDMFFVATGNAQAKVRHAPRPFFSSYEPLSVDDRWGMSYSS